MADTTYNSKCPNCGNDPGTEKFCPSCGQKNQSLKLNLSTIFGELFSILFNLDNLLVRTLKAAVVPGRLATRFIEGKRKTYLHPLRFFFYSWVLLAILLSLAVPSNSDSSGQDEGLLGSGNFSINIGGNTFKPAPNDSLSTDTLSTEPQTKKDFHIRFAYGATLHFTADSAKIIPPTDTLKTILYSDLEQLSPDSLYQKYDITEWVDKFKIKRAKRLDKGLEGILKYMMDHFIWLFFSVIPFSSLILWLFYGRAKKYYLEHIVYLLYLFSVSFVFIMLGILASFLPNPFVNIILTILLIGFFVYSYFSQKNYYGQSRLKTFFKWNTYLFFNMILFIIFAVFYSLISAALF